MRYWSGRSASRIQGTHEGEASLQSAMARLVFVGVVACMVAGACGGGASPAQPTVESSPPVPSPSGSLSTAPPLVVTVPSVPELPAGSQTQDDAARDGVVPELAALPSELRIEVLPGDFGPTAIEAPEGIWVISGPRTVAIPDLVNGCLIGNTRGVYGKDYVCVFEYGEILLLDSDTGAIVRAYPFPAVTPQALELTDGAVYAIRQGDGALPDSMLARIDRATLEAVVRIFPFEIDSAYGPGSDLFIPDHWTVDEPTSLVLWQRLAVGDEFVRISGYSGRAKVDPHTLALVEVTAG